MLDLQASCVGAMVEVKLILEDLPRKSKSADDLLALEKHETGSISTSPLALPFVQSTITAPHSRRLARQTESTRLT